MWADRRSGAGPSGARSPRDPRVLIVGGSPHDRAVLRGYLSHCFRVLEAAGGREGLALIDAQGPDYVLLADRLADVSGLDVLDAIQHGRCSWRLPVILMGAGAETEAALLSVKRGGAGHFERMRAFPRAWRSVLAREIDAMPDEGGVRRKWLRLGATPGVTPDGLTAFDRKRRATVMNAAAADSGYFVTPGGGQRAIEYSLVPISEEPGPPAGGATLRRGPGPSTAFQGVASSEASRELPGAEMRHSEVEGELQKSGEDIQLSGLLRGATRRRLGDGRIGESAQRHETAVRAGGAGLWEWDTRGSKVHYSPEWKAQLGFREDEITDCLNEWYSRVHAGDMDRLLRAVRAQLAQPQGRFSAEYRMRHRDGSYRWILNQASSLEDEHGRLTRMFGAHIDITEMRQAAEILKESEQRLRLFIRYAPAAIAMLDERLNYLAASRRWMADFGLAEGDLTGRCCFDVVPAMPEPWKIAHQRALQGETVRNDEARFLRQDGTERWLRWEVRPWHVAAGQVGGVVVVTEDITELRETQSALERSNRELEARTRAAEVASRAKGEVLANVSHEIRTPMNAIIGLTHQVLESDLEPRQRHYLERVHQASTALLRLLNDVLDYSRAEAGCLELEEAPFDLPEAVRAAGDLFLIQREEKGLSWTLEIDPALPRYVAGDGFRLNQVLVNLIANAVKFTERGGIALTIERAAQTEDTVTVRISVRDTGIGMTAAQRARLFMMFSQGDRSTPRRFGGSGLGLAIVRRLVDLMQGTIDVESAPGEGTAFVLTVALRALGTDEERPPDSGDHASIWSREGLECVHRIRGARILWVDGDPARAVAQTAWLSDLGVSVRYAHSSCEACRLATQDAFDLALVDPGLWDAHGCDLVRQLRSQSAKSGARITALIGYESTVLESAMAEHGIANVPVAPTDPTALIDSLLRWLAPVDRASESSGTGQQLDPCAPEPLEARLRELEDALGCNRLSARGLTDGIEALLAGTSGAEGFQPVADAVRRLQSREARAALAAFRTRRFGRAENEA